MFQIPACHATTHTHVCAHTHCPTHAYTRSPYASPTPACSYNITHHQPESFHGRGDVKMTSNLYSLEMIPPRDTQTGEDPSPRLSSLERIPPRDTQTGRLGACTVGPPPSPPLLRHTCSLSMRTGVNMYSEPAVMMKHMAVPSTPKHMIEPMLAKKSCAVVETVGVRVRLSEWFGLCPACQST
jgi:hypothetical protein